MKVIRLFAFLISIEKRLNKQKNLIRWKSNNHVHKTF